MMHDALCVKKIVMFPHCRMRVASFPTVSGVWGDEHL
jgi:hypothetical protein